MRRATIECQCRAKELQQAGAKLEAATLKDTLTRACSRNKSLTLTSATNMAASGESQTAKPCLDVLAESWLVYLWLIGRKVPTTVQIQMDRDANERPCPIAPQKKACLDGWHACRLAEAHGPKVIVQAFVTQSNPGSSTAGVAPDPQSCGWKSPTTMRGPDLPRISSCDNGANTASVNAAGEAWVGP